MRMPSTSDYLNKSNFVLGAVISDVKNICKFLSLIKICLVKLSEHALTTQISASVQ